jgi:ribosome modulation factor
MGSASPFDAAIIRGHNAFKSGKSVSDCPYKDIRKRDGRLTFGRAWVKAWHDGYSGLITKSEKDRLKL